MLVRNGELVAVHPSDIDENGRIVLPEGITMISDAAFINIANNPSCKEIVVNEGVKAILGYTFCDLPHVKKVVLPKSIVVLGDRVAAAFDSHIDVEINSNPVFSKNCFKDYKQYIKNKLDEIDKKLEKATTLEEVEECLEIYDSLIAHARTEKELKGHFDYITNKINKKLEQKIDGKEIYKSLVNKCFAEDKLLTPSLLQHDSYRTHKRLGIEHLYKPVLFDFCDKSAQTIDSTGEILFDQYGVMSSAKTRANNNNLPNKILNMYMLFVIKHEISHIYFGERSRNPKTKEDKILELDRRLIEAHDGYESGKESWHIAKHDFMPEEINADLKALNLLETSLIEDYGFSPSVADYIEIHKQKRVDLVVEAYGMKKGDDLRKVIMEEALASDRLTSSERQKLKEIYKEYMNIRQSGYKV